MRNNANLRLTVVDDNLTTRTSPQMSKFLSQVHTDVEELEGGTTPNFIDDRVTFMSRNEYEQTLSAEDIDIEFPDRHLWYISRVTHHSSLTLQERRCVRLFESVPSRRNGPSRYRLVRSASPRQQ